MGKSLTASFIPGMFMGVVYLTLIMWWVTGHTPVDVINAIADIINQPLQQIAKVIK